MARRAGAQRPGNGSEPHQTNWRSALEKADIAALLALGAAFFIAAGDVMHQRSAHEVTDEPVGHLGLFTRLLRDRQWWLGSVVAGGGIRAAGRCARFGSVLSGAGGAGHVIAVRAAHPGQDRQTTGLAVPVDVGGAAGGVGRRHRHGRQSTKVSPARRSRHGRWSRRAGPALVAVRDRRARSSPDPSAPYFSAIVPGALVGSVRGPDQRRGGPS